jgi:phosphoribosylanthranilate isomerase
MPATEAKICGLKTPEAVAAAMSGGAAYLGFVLFEKSPRHLTAEAAARLIAPVRQAGSVQIVALTVDPTDADIDHIVAVLKPDLIQLHGAAFDWTLLDGLRLERPWFLAGGLDPWNVAEAVRLSRAPLVDVSSGVERGPGVKDPDLIAAFLSAVRRA